MAALRCDDHPALVGGKGRVYNEPEPKRSHVEGNGFILIWNDQGYRRDVLLHGPCRYHVWRWPACKIRFSFTQLSRFLCRSLFESMGRAVVSPASKFAVLPQLRQVFAKMEVNILLVASKARLELSVGISAPQPPGAYDLAGPPNLRVSL